MTGTAVSVTVSEVQMKLRERGREVV